MGVGVGVAVFVGVVVGTGVSVGVFVGAVVGVGVDNGVFVGVAVGVGAGVGVGGSMDVVAMTDIWTSCFATAFPSLTVTVTVSSPLVSGAI